MTDRNRRSDAPGKRQRTAVCLSFILTVGLGLRVGAWLLTEPTMLVNDEFQYFFFATRWFSDDPPAISRPPLTSLVNAAAMELFGISKFVVRGAGVLFGSILVGLVYLVAARIGGRRAGLIAASVAAVYPTLIGFSHYIMSETYFLVLFLGAIYFALRLNDSFSLWTAAVTGILCGAAVLTREVGIVFTLAIALSVAWAQRHDLTRSVSSAAVVVSLAALVVAPWSLYLHSRVGGSAIVGRTTWMNIYIGNTPAGSIGHLRPFSDYKALGPTVKARELAARDAALRTIADRFPAWPFEKLTNLKGLFLPTSYPVKRLLSIPGRNGAGIGEWAYQFAWPPLNGMPYRRALAYLTAVSYILVAVAGIAGLTLSRNSGARVLLVVAASLIVPILLTFPNTRFRLPIECLFTVGTGLLFARGKLDWKHADTGQRIATVAAIITTAAIIATGSNAFMSRLQF